MKYLNEIVFLIIVLFTNVIQGITGFAGTVLAMPPSVMLIGFDTAKPILNVLGLLSGIYVLITSYRHVNKKEFVKIVAVMLPGIAAGLIFKNRLTGNTGLLYLILGVIVITVGVTGIIKTAFRKNKASSHNRLVSGSLLVLSGIVHGLFVCGGPLLVSYLAVRSGDKNEFRSTVSAVWIVLNSVIMFDDIRAGYWTEECVILLLPCVAVLFTGMLIGSILYKKMSRELFMKITYVLLIISGASLFIK